jgi:DNA-binding response OmpR family regulator
VLLDMHLPDIGGLSVVRELSEEIAEKRMKVVLLTGDHMSIDVVKAMSLGAHDYWLKPLTREHLRAGLVTALSA